MYNESQYIDLLKDVIYNGDLRNDRTNTGTLSVFGRQLKWDLRDNIFPLITTKRLWFRGIAEELLWFISGSTDAKILSQKGVHIWDANGSREFLDNIGLSKNREGDLGPIYGITFLDNSNNIF